MKEETYNVVARVGIEVEVATVCPNNVTSK